MLFSGPQEKSGNRIVKAALAPPNFRQLISLPFNYLYCILVLKNGEDGMKNGK